MFAKIRFASFCYYLLHTSRLDRDLSLQDALQTEQQLWPPDVPSWRGFALWWFSQAAAKHSNIPSQRWAQPQQRPALLGSRALSSLVIPSKHRWCFTQHLFAELIRKKTREPTQNCTGNQTLVQDSDRSSHYFLFSHIGWFPAYAQKWKSTHNKASLVGWELWVEWVALDTAGGTAPVGWRGPCPLTPNCPCLAVSCDPRDEQLWPRARPWAVSLVWQISSPGKGQKGRRKGREAIKRRKCWVGSGSYCMLHKSHSSPDKWRAFPSVYKSSFRLHHQTSFQVQIFSKPVACKPATLTIWFILDNLLLQYAVCLFWHYGNP